MSSDEPESVSCFHFYEAIIVCSVLCCGSGGYNSTWRYGDGDNRVPIYVFLDKHRSPQSLSYQRPPPDNNCGIYYQITTTRILPRSPSLLTLPTVLKNPARLYCFFLMCLYDRINVVASVNDEYSGQSQSISHAFCGSLCNI